MIVHVVADEVADTVKAVILGPNLGMGRGRVDAGEESHQTSGPKAEEGTVERLRSEKRMAGAGPSVLLTEAATASQQWEWADQETAMLRDAYSSFALEEGGTSQGGHRREGVERRLMLLQEREQDSEGTRCRAEPTSGGGTEPLLQGCPARSHATLSITTSPG